MAVEVEGTSQVEEFLGILRRRAWWIVVPTVVLGTLGVAAAVIVPKKYVSSSRVLVRDASGLVRPTPTGSVSRMEGMVAPYVVGSPERVTQVLGDLRWPDYLELTGADQLEYRASLVKNLHIELHATQANLGAQIVATRFAHTVPQRAHDFLHRLVTSWKDDVQRRFQTAERTRLETLRRQHDKLQADRVAVMKELEDTKRINRIRPDYELDRRGKPNYTGSQWDELERLERAIEADGRRIRELEVELRQNEQKFNEEPPTIKTTEAVAATSALQDLIKELERRRLELQLEIDQKLWTPANSGYALNKRAIAKIEKQLDEARGFSSSGTRTPEIEQINPVRLALRDAMERAQDEMDAAIETRTRNLARRDELRAEVEILNREINKIDFLEQRAGELSTQIEEIGIDLAKQQAQVDAIEGDAGKFFEDLDTPRVPLIPTEPNPLIISVLALFMGLALGLGLAVLTELSRSTFRSSRDLARVMALPVLGTVNRIVTRRQRARLLFARTALAVGTLAFVCVIGYVTWAWAYDVDSLSAPVRAVIDGLRQPFL